MMSGAIGAVPMIWNTFSIFRTNCAIAHGVRVYMLQELLQMLCMRNGVRNF